MQRHYFQIRSHYEMARSSFQYTNFAGDIITTATILMTETVEIVCKNHPIIQVTLSRYVAGWSIYSLLNGKVVACTSLWILRDLYNSLTEHIISDAKILKIFLFLWVKQPVCCRKGLYGCLGSWVTFISRRPPLT